VADRAVWAEAAGERGDNTMRMKLLLIGLLAVSMASAQRGGRGGGGGGMSMPSAGPYMKNHMEQMTDLLQLSKEQKKDIKTLMDDAQKEAAPLREQLVKGRAQIAAAIQAGQPEGVDGAIKSYSELEGQMAAVEMKAFAGIYKALDQEQKAKASVVFRMIPGIFTRKNWVDLPQ
jgi:Spy/CpxP family protein refolding chaperone